MRGRSVCIAVSVLFFVVPLSTRGQQGSPTPAAKRPPSQPQPKGEVAAAAPAASKSTVQAPALPLARADPLGQFVGSWDVNYSIFGAGGLSFGTGGQTIEQPDPNSISFSRSSFETRHRQLFPGGPTVPQLVTKTDDFVLRRDPQSGRYTLTAHSNYLSFLSIENLPLTYSPGKGFTGKGTVELGGKPVNIEVGITLNKEGGSSWSVAALKLELETEDEKKKGRAEIGLYSLTFKPQRKEAKN